MGSTPRLVSLPEPFTARTTVKFAGRNCDCHTSHPDTGGFSSTLAIPGNKGFSPTDLLLTCNGHCQPRRDHTATALPVSLLLPQSPQRSLISRRSRAPFQTSYRASSQTLCSTFHTTNPARGGAQGLRSSPAPIQKSLRSTSTYFQQMESRPPSRQLSGAQPGSQPPDFLFPPQQLSGYNKLLHHICPCRCHTFPKSHLNFSHHYQ